MIPTALIPTAPTPTAPTPTTLTPEAGTAGGLVVILPGDVDDAAAPSGGNTYDRRVCEHLAAAGRPVDRIAIAGTWPRPDATGREALDRALSGVPAGSVVLLDGLVACGVPDVVVPHAGRLRLAVLVHLPLADETGLSPADAADLDAREGRTLRAADAVVVTGEAVGHRVAARHGIPAGRVHVVPPGVDPAPATVPDPAGTRLLCVASVTPRKGHDVLVEALARLADLPWSCVCAGPLDRDPGHVTAVRRRIEAHGLGERVRLAGPRTGADLDGLYARADLLVLASRAEPYGMVVTEALARAVPVVVSDVDGLPQAVGTAPAGTAPRELAQTDRPGILVPAGDPAALAAALRTWLTGPAVRDDLRAAAARRRLALRGWEDTTASLAAVLDRAAGLVGTA